MNAMLKMIVIALALVVACGALLSGVKSYGVWVISAAAVVLFVVGLLRKDEPEEKPGKTGKADRPDGAGGGSDKSEDGEG